MTTELEHRLAEAADDTDRPLGLSVDDIVRRGRLSVRRRRIAAIASAGIATAAVIGAVSGWPTHEAGPAPVAGTPTHTTTIDIKTGKIISPAPPVSSLTDDDIRQRCARADEKPATWDKAGPIDNNWIVAVKTGTGERFYAVLLSPDRSVGAGCEQEGGGFVSGIMRHDLANRSGTESLPLWTNESRGPANLAAVTAEAPDGKYLRTGLVGRDGFFTFGQGGYNSATPLSVVRGYDAAGKLVMERRLPLG